LDRPRQQVDYVHGKPAITHYTTTDRQRVILQPKTGRTHQLRVHCAHPDGLNRPIKGDTLYGSPSDRLYLHAESITFNNPLTKKRVTFTSNGTPF
jgi:tRNA pseudouridine32 synthase/23S rRNA pseudouridine746 synthase